jgi:hypothetical protein
VVKEEVSRLDKKKKITTRGQGQKEEVNNLAQQFLVRPSPD